MNKMMPGMLRWLTGCWLVLGQMPCPAQSPAPQPSRTVTQAPQSSHEAAPAIPATTPASPSSRATTPAVQPSNAITPVIYNIRDYGAVGDGKTLDTRAINLAIKTAASHGGGTVWFPAGNWLSYSIHLCSNISLYLDQGATLLAAEPAKPGPAGAGITNRTGIANGNGIANSSNIANGNGITSGNDITNSIDTISGYDTPEPNAFSRYQDFGHSHWHNSLIWGDSLENISILGPGLIYGKGLTRSTRPDKGAGNKAIALRLCRNVTLRDFTILYGGHFGILATGVDNFTVSNVKMDTNRDGIDVDCCRQVHISDCSINSPWDDGICLKSSFGLGFARATENVTITNCLVSGFDRGTFYDGTYQQKEYNMVPDKDGPTGRIKFGTESNGGYKNITISNCVFDHCRGLALETVDGGLLEDVTISNITMRDINNSPLFLRLGSRMRGPAGTPVGSLRRVLISNVTVYNADSRFASIISGIPGHAIEDIRLENIHIWYKPLDSLDNPGSLVVRDSTNVPVSLAARDSLNILGKAVAKGPGKASGRQPIATTQSVVAVRSVAAPPEKETGYPEPSTFGVLPAYGFFIRHAKNIQLDNIQLVCLGKETRPAFVLQDTKEVDLQRIRALNDHPVIIQ